ncbi:16S rRNA (guanine(966)-N(2))-methyltransferase RsmD [Algirhabdus cladophorae]|uniref:16S rRNA (guanine(966)-N(2))-methyltransferase RsmD n=1 Tax=Algirhabdus cladophorae TaxID=3377108 RepID=UPI003B8468D9
MRIIGGTFRGLVLASVGKGDAGAHLRPTTDRVRETLFNVLQGGRFGDPVEGAHVLDLFAGTGALGLEALSRGAEHVTFVDDGRKAQSLIAQNIKKCRVQGQADLVRCDALRLPKCEGAPADLVFLDPPYGKGLGQKALVHAVAQGWITAGAFVVFEDSQSVETMDGFDVLESRKYGDTQITFLEGLGPETGQV